MRKRNRVISIRLTETEHKTVKDLANKSGLSVTDFLLKCSMGKKINVIDIKPLYTEVKRVGGNIHQIAKLANFGKINAVNLSGVKDELSKIYDEIQKITKRCS